MACVFDSIIFWLKTTAETLPLPIFVVVGGLVEELVAPIPSPLVTTLAGSIASSQGLGIPALLLICALATLAKTIGTVPFYYLGYKLEHVAVPRFGKYIGVSQSDIDALRMRFSGTWKDELTIALLRSIPVMPSTPISVVTGILGINFWSYSFSTYVGFYVRNLIFMVIGYTGLSAAESLMKGIDAAETVLKIGIVILAILVLGWLYWKRRKGSPMTWFRR